MQTLNARYTELPGLICDGDETYFRFGSSVMVPFKFFYRKLLLPQNDTYEQEVMVICTYLDLGFADLKPLCQFLSGQRIRILSFLEGFFKFLNLLRSKFGSVSPLVQSGTIVATAVPSFAGDANAVGVRW